MLPKVSREVAARATLAIRKRSLPLITASPSDISGDILSGILGAAFGGGGGGNGSGGGGGGYSGGGGGSCSC